jgi:hypothetical protein
MTENTIPMKKKPGRPVGTSKGGTQRQVLSISLLPDDQVLLLAVKERYNVTQSALFSFILHNAWLLSVPAIELEALRRRRDAGDD